MVLDTNQPVKGKTYSLFGNYSSTNFFYERVGNLTNQILKEEQLSMEQLLEFMQQVSRSRRGLKRIVRRNNPSARLTKILDLLHESLQEYTTGIESHLKSTPSYKLVTDKELFTTREQYYLYMIEFELVNRIHKNEFLGANYKIALLPYCLRETQDNCKAEPDKIDYCCKGCLKGCHINHVSKLLRKNKVEPYIWRRSKLKPLLSDLVKAHGSVGVLGMACIVELVMGMRRCMKAHLPVVGIPLNANRCPRWMDTFHETSVDLNALERLLALDKELS
jgi:hypothetical protein